MNRTAAAVVGIVTFVSLLNVTSWLTDVLAETHPDNTFATAWQELLRGPA